MTAGAISSSSSAAMAAGVRAEFQAKIMRVALDSADLVTDQLDAAFDALEAGAQQLTEAGAKSMQSDLVGTLIDITG